jgi:hypothetical protein
MQIFFNRVRTLFKNLVGSKAAERDLAEEYAYHVERLTEENIEKGLAPKVAKKAALKEFGNVEALKESSREAWGVLWLMGMVKEFRQGLRLLWKSKSFTAAVVITLAICLAGNTVVFSILDKVLSPPAYPQPNRVVNLFNSYSWVNEPSNRLGGKIILRPMSIILETQIRLRASLLLIPGRST